MPFKSERQRRYIYSQASQGSAWARKFIKDSGAEEPAIRKQAIHRARRKHGKH